MNDKTKTRIKNETRPIPLLVHIFTLGALTTVILGLARTFGHLVGLTGTPGAIVGGFIAILLDLAWIGALNVTDTALKARQYKQAGLAATFATAAAAGSVYMLIGLGHLPALAYLPAAALIVNAARIGVDNFYTDRATAVQIAERFAAEVNDAAVHQADLTLEGAGRDRAAEREVADAAATSRRELALAKQIVAEHVRQNREYAALQAEVDASVEEHGEAADKFRAWLAGASIAGRLSAPVLGPSVPVTGRPVSTAEDADTAVEAARTVVDTELARALAETPDDDVMAVAEAAGTVPRPLDTTSKIGTREDTEGEPGGEVADATSNLVPATPALTDDELYEAGLNVWLALGEPRSQARFLAALKDAGIRASTARKRELHKRLAAEHATT